MNNQSDEASRAALTTQAPAEPASMREALVLAIHAMRAPFDGWKGELERKALDAANAALAAPTPVEPAAWLATKLWNARETWSCPADIEKLLTAKGHRQ